MTGRIASYLAPALIALVAALGVANWVVKPASAWAWVFVLVFAGVMMAAVLLSRNVMTGDERRKAVAEINQAVIVAGGILTVSLAVALARTAGFVDSHEFAARATMVLTGLFLVLTGNAAPKTLTPLATMRCDPARTQAFQRFFGVTCVLAGLTFAVAGLTLPVKAASVVGMAAIVVAIAMNVAHAMRLRKPGRA